MQQPAQTSSDDRIQYLTQLISPNWHSIKLLDIGCGNGFVCEQLSQRSATCVGVDIVPLQGQPQNWQFKQVDLDHGPWSTGLIEHGPFNLILAFDIIEHVSSPWQLLSEIRRLLSSGGQLVLSTPNISSWERLKHPQNWSGATDPEHKHLFNAYSLQFLLRRAGFNVHRVEAPIRKLGNLNRWLPAWGGQLQATAGI